MVVYSFPRIDDPLGVHLDTWLAKVDTPPVLQIIPHRWR